MLPAVEAPVITVRFPLEATWKGSLNVIGARVASVLTTCIGHSGHSNDLFMNPEQRGRSRITCLDEDRTGVGVACNTPVEGSIMDGKCTRQVFSASVRTEKLYAVR